MVRKREIVLGEKLLTLSVVAFSILIYCSPRLSGVFVYHRQAILDGEIWRLFTAPFVHFSFSHIFWDTLVFGIAGLAVGVSGFPRFWLLCVMAAFIPGVIYIKAFPGLEYYGGLSGLSTGAVIYYCLCNIFLTDKRKKIWILTLAVTGVKILIEIILSKPVFANPGSVDFTVLPSAHIIGFLVAAFTAILTCPRSVFRRINSG